MRVRLPPVLTVRDLAELLRLDEETVRRKVRRGYIPCIPGLRPYRIARSVALRILKGELNGWCETPRRSL
jgi:hypothetical protein